MDNIVEEFFGRRFEDKVNKDILFYTYSQDKVKMYVESVINEPLDRYLSYIENMQQKEIIKSEDVFQFSSIEDATDSFCEKVKSINNPGLTHLEVGKLLQDDGKERKDSAYVKYGENHSKFAKELGLAFELCNTYYLSGIGYTYSELGEEDKEKLLVRLMIRSTLIKRIYQACQNGTVNLREFLYMLADSTYLRRKSNVKKVVGYIEKSSEMNFFSFSKLVKY